MDDHLRKFLAVAEAGSFTKAAAQLHISQPSLSMSVSALERRLKVKLFVRGRRLKLTNAGKLVRESAAKLRLEERNLLNGLEELIGSAAKLRLGLIDSLAEDFIFSTSARVAEIKVDNTSRLIGEVGRDGIDMAFVTLPAANPGARFEVRRLGYEPFALVSVPENTPLLLKNIRRKALVDNLLSYDKNSTTFYWLERHLRAKGLNFKVKLYSTSPDLMLEAALRGRGPAFLPLKKVRQELKSGRLRRVSAIMFCRPIAVVCLKGKLKGKAFSGAVKAVKKSLRNE